LFSSVVPSTIGRFRKISWAQFENEVKDWGWANGGIKKIFQHLDRHLPAPKLEWQEGKTVKGKCDVIYV